MQLLGGILFHISHPVNVVRNMKLIACFYVYEHVFGFHKCTWVNVLILANTLSLFITAMYSKQIFKFGITVLSGSDEDTNEGQFCLIVISVEDVIQYILLLSFDNNMSIHFQFWKCAFEVCTLFITMFSIEILWYFYFNQYNEIEIAFIRYKKHSRYCYMR